MQYLFEPLHHLRRIRDWAQNTGALLHLDPCSFLLTIERGAARTTFYPRFTIVTAGGFAYTHRFGSSGNFVGWLPYEARRWPVASDKLIFKRWCMEQGLRTPDWGTQAPPPGCDYLVKHRRGSFGRGISGPWRAGERSEPVSEDHFFEEFKFGISAKAWYWRERPVAVEFIRPPHALGDGVRSVRELLQNCRGSYDTCYEPAHAETVLQWQGISLDAVPRPGQKVWLGYKYANEYDRVVMYDRDHLPRLAKPVRQQFQDAGTAFRKAVPEEFRDTTVYTIDAVIKPDESVWFLEMNSHPMVHPAVYPVMLTDLYAAGEEPVPFEESMR